MKIKYYKKKKKKKKTTENLHGSWFEGRCHGPHHASTSYHGRSAAAPDVSEVGAEKTSKINANIQIVTKEKHLQFVKTTTKALEKGYH